MRQYSADQVEVTFLGNDLKEGLSQGTFITVANTTPAFSYVARGAISDGTSVFNPDRSGTITLTVDQTSTTHQLLMQIHKDDIQSRNQVGTFLVDDKSNGEKTEYINARITDQVPLTRGNEAATFAWVLTFQKATINPVSPNTINLVGT